MPLPRLALVTEHAAQYCYNACPLLSPAPTPSRFLLPSEGIARVANKSKEFKAVKTKPSKAVKEYLAGA